MMKNFVLLAVALGGIFLVPQCSIAQKRITARPLAQEKTFRVAIDAGGGGQSKGDVVAGVAAKDINLSLARKLKTELETRGIQVVMTRTEDKRIPLSDRVKFVEKQKIDCLVSLQVNNSSQHPNLPLYVVNYKGFPSEILANLLNSHLAKTPETVRIKDSKQLSTTTYAPLFFVLRKVSAPATVVSGNLTFLRNSQAQDRMVQSISDGITDFFQGKWKKQRRID